MLSMSATVSGLPHALTDTLMRVGRELKTLQDPWWILGSSAIAILGYEAGPIGDVDILVSERDAVHLMSAHNLANTAEGGTELYRSDFFLHPAWGPMPVEIMAGYQIRRAGDWISIVPASRVPVSFGDVTLYVPDTKDQRDLLKLLGRPKDLPRIALLDRPLKP